MPPPAGGISIHLERLNHLLSNEYDTDFIDESTVTKPKYFNIRTFKILEYLKIISKTDLVFIHGGNRLFKKLHIIISKLFRKKIVTTIHGYGNERNFIFRKWDSFFFNQCDRIILVNDMIQLKLDLTPGKCIVRHAFLPPIMENEPPLPEVISDWIKVARSNNHSIVIANASRLETFNGEDLYGLDMLLRAALDNKKMQQQKMSFIFIVSGLDAGKERFEQGKTFISDHNLEADFLLIHDRISFVQLITEADIVVRPTNTDGDALTIREGLYLGKKVLASDVVKRPEGTYLFKTRDQFDFNQKLFELISDKTKNTSHRHQNENELHFYQELIESLIK
jgi:glycosyltransferase involved in cell wall biosynthesis